MSMSRLLPIVLFVAYLYAGMGLLLLFGVADEASERENRTLAARPRLTAGTVWSGEFFRRMDNYAADHIAFRDRWVAASKTIESWRGFRSKDNAQIVLTEANNTDAKAPAAAGRRNGQAAGSAQPARPSASSDADRSRTKAVERGTVVGKVLIAGDRAMSLYKHVPQAGAQYAQAINRLHDSLGRGGYPIRLSVLLAPSAVEFEPSPRLRALADSQAEAIGAVYRRLDSRVQAIDALPALRAHAGEYLYFRTDHHWTATGAYYAYTAWADTLGMTPVPLSAYRQEQVTGFLGSLYTATLNNGLEKNPDRIVLYKPFVPHDYVVHYQGPLRMALLDMRHAARRNKYRIFLSGDRPWGTITAFGQGQRRIAVIKDSYGNAFIPFLLPHCKEIYVIDPRQFRQPLADFVRKHGIHELLVLNNAEVASHTGYTRLLESLY